MLESLAVPNVMGATGAVTEDEKGLEERGAALLLRWLMLLELPKGFEAEGPAKGLLEGGGAACPKGEDTGGAAAVC